MSDLSASSFGQRDLSVLLKTMAPVLREEEFVFCSIPADGVVNLRAVPWGLFREEEGTTVILTVDQAIHCHLPIANPWRMITLTVHSDLQAVGFLAALTQALARANISVNAISAYFHDHLFVPRAQAQAAMDCVLELAKEARNS